eukprot:m.112057 g.112057  ORF g.112057 m.112057 type:complete len:78 (-) comp9388_c1_seq3:1751-1984(-)
MGLLSTRMSLSNMVEPILAATLAPSPARMPARSGTRRVFIKRPIKSRRFSKGRLEALLTHSVNALCTNACHNANGNG